MRRERGHRVDEVLHLALDDEGVHLAYRAAGGLELLDAVIAAEIPVLDRKLVCRADDARDEIVRRALQSDLVGADACAELHRIEISAALAHDIVSVAAAEDVSVVAIAAIEDVIAAGADERVVAVAPVEVIRRSAARDAVVVLATDRVLDADERCAAEAKIPAAGRGARAK